MESKGWFLELLLFGKIRKWNGMKVLYLDIIEIDISKK